MAPKKSIPPPIDRPLSKAYLRQFSGWSDQYPPGQSEPTSLRVMENVMVDRNGAVAVRPGLRHLTYTESPAEEPGTASDLVPVGSFEPFYLNDGSRAYLYAVREPDLRVGFRALLLKDGHRTVATPVECGFSNYSGTTDPFSAETSYVQYVQIDNTIIAMSDSGEPARHFHAGVAKSVSVPQEITVPEWGVSHKPRVVHPDASWIDVTQKSVRTNLLLDPEMRYGAGTWKPQGRTSVAILPGVGLELRSLPERTNLVRSPLHDVSATGTSGWVPRTNCTVEAEEDFLLATSEGPGWFAVESTKMLDGIEEKRGYVLALDPGIPIEGAMFAALKFYSCSGAPIGEATMHPVSSALPRWVSGPVTAPEGAVSARVLVGSDTTAAVGELRFKNVLLCREGEPTTMFHGGSGADYFWEGPANGSRSTYHPPVDAVVVSTRAPVVAGKPYSTGVSCKGPGNVVALDIRTYTATDSPVGGSTATTTSSGSSFAAMWNNKPTMAAGEKFARTRITARMLGRGQVVSLSRPVLEQTSDPNPFFFSGSSDPGPTVVHAWTGPPHRSASTRTEYSAAKPVLNAETPAATTLVSNDSSKNTYKIGIFYTFENDVGETMGSRITEVRMMRPWSNWLWRRPAADGQPTGAVTDDPNQCADQLVIEVPRTVFDLAVAQGAKRWSVYAMSWSDQDPVPVTAEKVAVRELYPDPFDSGIKPRTWESAGWIAITPSRFVSSDWRELPVQGEPNYSFPLRHRTGVAAGDRLIMVGDPTDPATVSWSSNQPGRYTAFTPSAGGGQKTLSSGNLHMPNSIVLWQNPQSVDTLTALCSSETERSIAYYMTPYTTNTQQGTIYGMGFEETTNTPGCESPYAAEVLNNALYRPVDTALIKSTASNYNISHKVMTEQIARRWTSLLGKYRMVSAQLDNRLYYLVHNSAGAPLEKDCAGNEVWVLDIAAEQGHWSRFLIQAVALEPIEIGGSSYVGVVRPQGLAYLDPEHRWDDVVDEEGLVRQVPIPWRLETNLQGANRAHDAWAHLQQMAVTFGSFEGSVRWGLRGYTMHGQWLDLSKTTVAQTPDSRMHEWAQEDHLLVRRDMKEWYFHAQSIPDVQGWGSVQLVQYRYTPTTVNVGYEYGSVETFEYGTPAPGTYAANGVPQPFSDAGRSWV